METAELDAIDGTAHPIETASVIRSIGDAVDAQDVALVYYELEPGEAFSGALHTHHDQEEIFYILSGTATFLSGLEREEVTVPAGSVIRFAPGDFQVGMNRTNETVSALVIAAPSRQHEWDEVELYFECRQCEVERRHTPDPIDSTEWKTGQIDLEITCKECGSSFSTADISISGEDVTDWLL